MKRFPLRVVILAIAAFLCSLAIPTAAEARINVHCAGGASSHLGIPASYDAGIRQVDPLVSHGEAVSMHEHQFFGSLRLAGPPESGGMTYPQWARYQDLLKSKTTCNMPNDTAAYWAPVLRYKATGEVVPIMRFEAYYQSWDNRTTDPLKQTRPFPADLRMVAGNPMAMSEADVDLNAMNFSCGMFSTKAAKDGKKYPSIKAADCSTAESTTPGRESRFLTAIVHFPTCWDGRKNDHDVMGDTTDFNGSPTKTGNHLAYTVRGKCPAGFPVKLMHLRYTQQWDYRGDGTDVYLSSGMGDAAGEGFTFHADFWNTWDQVFLSRSVAQCINTALPDTALHGKQPGQCGIAVPG